LLFIFDHWSSFVSSLYQCQVRVFAPTHRDQLAEAADHGRADDVIALLAEGADFERKDQARQSVLIPMLPSLTCMWNSH
jgi:hypothetical protein